MKKIFIIVLIASLWCSSVAFAFVIGGSNLGIMGYPEFNFYLPYDPSRNDIARYVEEAKEYVENCNNDIQRIHEAKLEAISQANDAVNRYNRGY